MVSHRGLIVPFICFIQRFPFPVKNLRFRSPVDIEYLQLLHPIVSEIRYGTTQDITEVFLLDNIVRNELINKTENVFTGTDMNSMNFSINTIWGSVDAKVITFSLDYAEFETTDNCLPSFLDIEFELLSIPYKCNGLVVKKLISGFNCRYSVKLSGFSDIDIRLLGETLEQLKGCAFC